MHCGSILFVYLLCKGCTGSDVMIKIFSSFKIHGRITKRPMQVITAESELHCAQLCVRHAYCRVSVFSQNKAKQSAEPTMPPGLTNPRHLTFPRPTASLGSRGSKSCFLFVSIKGDNVTRDDGADWPVEHADVIVAPKNCKEAYGLRIQRTSGVIDLKGIGDHYCKMDMGQCSKGGWTLALKVDGSKNTFAYASQYWTNTATYNVRSSLLDIGSSEEGKFPAFSKLSFDKLCLEMKSGSGEYRAVELRLQDTSLLNIFKRNVPIRSHAGRNAWTSLVKDSSLQVGCNYEGVNYVNYRISVRVGIQGNNEQDCLTPDSVIGIGINYWHENFVCSVSSGNCATCGGSGDRSTPMLTYLYIN